MLSSHAYALALALMVGFTRGAPTIRFALSYGDNMVLQRDASVGVWGFASEGPVTVTLSGCGKPTSTQHSKVSDEGTWRVEFEGGPASSCGHSITAFVTAHPSDTIALSGVLFGDVYVCSGQSNMEFTVASAFNASAEIAAAGDFPLIRVMTVSKKMSSTPLIDLASVEEPWSVASAESMGNGNWTYFSAVCWFFGRDLFVALGGSVPIGLIDTNWGGTPIESWSSPDALAKCPHRTTPSKQAAALLPGFNLPWRAEELGGWNDSVLWNAMIVPLLPMTIKGAVWYQGENNCVPPRDPTLYACFFPNMIADWRANWGATTHGGTEPLFPFAFVQLASWNDLATDYGGAVPIVRWGQTANKGSVPNSLMPKTIMAVAVDLGDPTSPWGDVHPRYKQEVGRRLVLGALNITYHKEVSPSYTSDFPSHFEQSYWTGPIASSVARQDGNLQILFDGAGDSGLIVKNELGFEYCGQNCSIEGGVWEPSAVLASTQTTVTILVTEGSATPTHVRYNWRQAACQPTWGALNCAVYSKDEGLPSPPFFLPVAD